MKLSRVSVILALGLCLSVIMGACGAPSTGNGGPGAPGATSQPTAAQPTTASRPKPTSPPKVTKAFCESVMTIADANQIMHPPTPITTMTAQANDDLGVCGYTSPQTPLGVVKILIDEKTYTGPNPVPESTIVQQATQLAQENGVTVHKATPVSGVGDQAEFVEASLSGNGTTYYADAIYVIYGKVAFMCDDFHINTKPDEAAQQTSLTQCAERVVNHL